MSYFALVLVIEADSLEYARECVDPENPNFAEIVFRGEPWEVKPMYDPGADQVVVEPEFDTRDVVAQRARVDLELLREQYETLSRMAERRGMDWTEREGDAVEGILRTLEALTR